MYLYLALAGSTFKKVYIDPIDGKVKSNFLGADDVIVYYGEKDLETAFRITHKYSVNDRERKILEKTGIWKEYSCLESEYGYGEGDELQESKDIVAGVEKKIEEPDKEYKIYEIYTYLDLKGFEYAEGSNGEGEALGIPLPYKIWIDEKRKVS